MYRTNSAVEYFQPAFESDVAENHDPPAASQGDEDVTGDCVISAVKDIQPGEEITISYIDEGQPLAERRADLADYGFVCCCARCVAEEDLEGEDGEDGAGHQMSREDEGDGEEDAGEKGNKKTDTVTMISSSDAMKIASSGVREEVSEPPGKRHKAADDAV